MSPSCDYDFHHTGFRCVTDVEEKKLIKIILLPQVSKRIMNNYINLVLAR
ncbi:MAG: hypothetical protein WBB45_09370 [Cyclobacteriaceae bacterium]